MGCASSKAAFATSQQNRMHQMMQNQMSAVTSMQQQHISKQQQMMRDDPECKHLMDKQMEIQKRTLEAMSRGDASSSLQAQNDMMELMKNPKMMTLMMPDLSLMTKMGNVHQGVNAAPVVSEGIPPAPMHNAAYDAQFFGMQQQAMMQNNIAVGGPILQSKGRRFGL